MHSPPRSLNEYWVEATYFHCVDSGLTHETQAPPFLGTRVLQVWGPTAVISENRLVPPMVPKKMEEG